mgnify:CR=1
MRMFPYIFGERLTGHVLVNNWSNGWSFDSAQDKKLTTIYLVFWPQVLEFIGFALLPLSFLWLLRKK